MWGNNMNEKVYLVVQTGIYIRAVLGCFTSLEAAVNYGREIRDNDYDSYHEYDVYTMIVNADRQPEKEDKRYSIPNYLDTWTLVKMLGSKGCTL